MKTIKKLWIGIAVLAVLSPLGIILPEYFKAGDAWGEWDMFPAFWSAPIPDYAFKGWEEKGLASLSFAYIISAALGIAVTVVIALIIGKVLVKKGD